MQEDDFLVFLQHFQRHTNCSSDHKVLLLLDNPSSHVSIKCIDYCRANGIVMLSYPPHCSHKLQPLDRTVYGPFKKAVNTACDGWMRTNPGKTMTISDIPSIVATALPRAMTLSNVQAGFRNSGICPYNRQIFSDLDFAPSYVTDRPNSNALQNENNTPAFQNIVTSEPNTSTVNEPVGQSTQTSSTAPQPQDAAGLEAIAPSSPRGTVIPQPGPSTLSVPEVQSTQTRSMTSQPQAPAGLEDIALSSPRRSITPQPNSSAVSVPEVQFTQTRHLEFQPQAAVGLEAIAPSSSRGSITPQPALSILGVQSIQTSSIGSQSPAAARLEAITQSAPRGSVTPQPSDSVEIDPLDIYN